MKPISLIVLVALTVMVNCMPAPVDQSRADILETLLPMFSKIKIKSVVSARTLEFVRRFFDLNPKFYETFKTALAPERIYLPEFSDLKWDVIQKQDFDDIIAIVGDASFAEAVEQSFLDNLLFQIESNDALVTRLESRVNEAGVTYVEPIDVNRVGKVLEKNFMPMIAAFTPIAMQILWFGKREIVEEKIDFNQLLGQLQQTVESVLPTLLPTLLQTLLSGIGKRDVGKLNIQQIKPIIQQLIQQAQQFFQSHPQIFTQINQQLAQFGIQLPRIDIDWNEVLQGALNTLPSIIIPSLISLFGKRDLEKFDFEALLGQIGQIITQNVLPNLLQTILSSIGKSNAEKFDFNQLLGQLQQAVESVLPSLLPTLLNTLLSGIGKRDLEKFDFEALLGQIGQIITQNVLPNLLQTILSSIGKSNAEKFDFNQLLGQLQQAVESVLPSLLPTLLQTILSNIGKSNIEKIDFNQILQQLGDAALTALPSIILPTLISLIGK